MTGQGRQNLFQLGGSAVLGQQNEQDSKPQGHIKKIFVHVGAINSQRPDENRHLCQSSAHKDEDLILADQRLNTGQCQTIKKKKHKEIKTPN